MYRSERMLTSAEWLEHFERLRGYLTATWDGLIIVIGDINVDLLRPNKPITSQIPRHIIFAKLTSTCT